MSNVRWDNLLACSGTLEELLLQFSSLFWVKNRCLSTSPWRWSDPWNLSAEQWILSASCVGLHEGASTWCDLGRSSPSSWEQTFLGQTTKLSCFQWNQVVRDHCEIAEVDKDGLAGVKSGRPNSGECERYMMRENGKKSKRHTHPTCLEPTHGEILSVQNVLFAPPVAYKGIAVACERKLGKTLCSMLHPFEEAAIVGQRFCKILENCTHFSCNPVVDHHELEDDDHEAENCHQLIQPEPWSTRHATRFSVHDVCWSVGQVVAWPVRTSLCCWTCCPWRCRIWRSGRIATLHWCPTSTAFFYFFRKKTMIVEKSAPDWIGAVAFPWLSSTLPRIALFPTVC